MTRATCQHMKRTLALAAALCLTFELSACGPDVPPETTVNQKTEQFNELMKRPDIDQAVARYEEMYAKIRAKVTKIVPSLKWTSANPMTSASCGNDFAAVNADLRRDDAEVKSLASWVAQGKVPDPQWDSVQAAVSDILRGYGFDSGPTVVKNQPSDHYVTYRAPDGSEVTFGSSVNTSATVRTGCHLTAEAKKRGTPAAVPTY
ncbi:LppA family lipoprotein [Amycolatopsis sp. VS8301801F10]|uniref:LppA family lipoprotein n=1 Tax=Amycolatopsis sp. VS8301801F10 TaxID=2652442 RepID=UPI0038FCE6C9